jgi:hypothetical protein
MSNIHTDYLQGFINQFGDGELGELNPQEWDVLQFLKWLKLNNFKIIKRNHEKHTHTPNRPTK